MILFIQIHCCMLIAGHIHQRSVPASSKPQLIYEGFHHSASLVATNINPEQQIRRQKSCHCAMWPWKTFTTFIQIARTLLIRFEKAADYDSKFSNYLANKSSKACYRDHQRICEVIQFFCYRHCNAYMLSYAAPIQEFIHCMQEYRLSHTVFWCVNSRQALCN